MKIFLKLAIISILIEALPSLAVDQSAVPSRPVGKSGHEKITLSLKKIDVSKSHSMAGRLFGAKEECSDGFYGTYPGSTLYLNPKVNGLAGGWTHLITYQLSHAYELKNKDVRQITIKPNAWNGNVFKIRLPELKSDVPFVQQSFTLFSTNEQNKTVSTSLSILIARPVILTPTSNSRTSCYQRYPAKKYMGTLTNGTDSESTVEISQGMQRIWGRNQGWQSGVYFSPLVSTALGNLLTLYYNYFQDSFNQTVESSTVSQSFQIQPQETVDVYMQGTRYITAYNATLMDACGKRNRQENAYRFQWWGYAMHLVPVDESIPDPMIGASLENTCPDDYSMENILNGNSNVEFRELN